MEIEKDFLVDSNILIYHQNTSSDCEEERLVAEAAMKLIFECKDMGIINYSLTVYREIAVRMKFQFRIDEYLELMGLSLVEENKDIMYLAASRYSTYLEDLKRRRLTSKEHVYRSKTIPADCIIGATALKHNLTLITNNSRDFLKYFPELKLKLLEVPETN